MSLEANYVCIIKNFKCKISLLKNKIISNLFSDGISVQNLTEPVYIMLKVPLYYYAGKKLLPVVWDETLNKSGGWTSDGCHLRNVLNNLIVFHCNRLGYYGLLQDTSSFDYDDNRYIL